MLCSTMMTESISPLSKESELALLVPVTCSLPSFYLSLLDCLRPVVSESACRFCHRSRFCCRLSRKSLSLSVAQCDSTGSVREYRVPDRLAKKIEQTTRSEKMGINGDEVKLGQ